jgi:single-strand DNA-binding protein
MSSVNKVILVGNCGRDPEVRYLQSGVAACSISIATSSKRKDKQSGELIEETQWHRVQFFDRLAEVVGEYVTKGSSLYVEGRLKYGKYTNKDGVEQNTCDIIASEMQMLGGRDRGGDRAEQQQAPQRSAAPTQQQRPTQAPPPRAAPARQSGGGFEDMDDDIPFIDPMKRRAFCLAI